MDRDQARLLPRRQRELRDAPPLLRELRRRELDPEVGRAGQIDLARGRQRLQRGGLPERSRRSSTRRSPRSPNIEHYFSALQAPFDRTAGKSILDLNDLADDLRSEFAAPTGDATTSWALGLASEIAGVSGAVESDVAGGLSGISALFSLAAYLTQENGTSMLGTEISTKAGQLGHELYDRYELAQEATTGIALLFVSDWGKMRAAAGKLDNDWKLPATMASASASLKLSAKRWFAESLVPTAFPTCCARRRSRSAPGPRSGPSASCTTATAAAGSTATRGTGSTAARS